MILSDLGAPLLDRPTRAPLNGSDGREQAPMLHRSNQLLTFSRDSPGI